jgi:hypothetical protein
MDTDTIKPSEFAEALRFCRKANLVAYISSPPGLGKSTITSSLAKDEGLNFFDTRLAYMTPSDVRGYATLKRDDKGNPLSMMFAQPDEYPRTPGNVWLLDEYTQAPLMVRNCALQLTLDRRIGSYIVPDDTLIVLAGNRSIDATFSERNSSALVNRVVQYTLRPDLDDWTKWAIQEGVDLRVQAFVRWRPELLSSFSGADWDGYSSFPSPRSWEFVDRALKANVSKNLRWPTLRGLVGPGAAVEFEAFLSTFESLPSLDGILLDPQGSKIPTEPAVLWATCAGLITKTTPANFDRVLTYLGRLRKEFEVFVVSSAKKLDEKIIYTQAFINWAVDNQSVLQ